MATNTDYQRGKLTGAHLRFLELAKGLARNDEVMIISRKIPQLESVCNIKFSHINDNDYRLLPDHIETIVKISKQAQKISTIYHFDVAISFTPFITIAYGLAGIPNIVSLFREDLIGYHKIIGTSKLKIRYYFIFERIAVKKSKKIIVQCINDKMNLINRQKKYEKNIEKKVYIQINNVNASWMQGNKKQNRENKTIEILFIGEFSNIRKGQDILLPVVARLLDSRYPIRLTVAGDGKNLNTYKELYKNYKDIVFVGRVRVSDYITESDILIVPSLIDSCPNTVLEGLNFGVAVYGANTGGIPDLLKDEKYLFAPNERDLELFLKDVLDSNRFEEDAYEQKTIQEELTFDWAKRMKGIIDA